MARIVAGVAGVMLVMAIGSGVMLAAIPSHLHKALTAATPIVRHPENCRPVDQWLVDARHDLSQNRPHVALRDIALSRRDCGPDSERYRLEGLAYQRIGDELSAIAAFRNYGDETGDYEPLRSANLDAERRAADEEAEHAAAMQRQLDILQAQLEAATRAGLAASRSAIGDFPVARPIPVSQDITTPVGASLPRIVTVPRDDDGTVRLKPRF